MIPPEWPTCLSSEGVMRDEYRLPRQGRQGAAGSTTGNPGRRKRYRGNSVSTPSAVFPNATLLGAVNQRLRQCLC
jgi:hypothetical protein